MYGLRQPKPQVSQAHSMPAPVGGINDLDGLAVMGEQFMIDCMNFFPDTGSLNVRLGYREHITGLNLPVKTIMEYHALNGNFQVYAATDAGIYFINPSADAPAPVKASTNGQYEYVNYSTPAAHYLVAVNGQQSVLWNGTAWIDFTLVATPVAPGEIKGVNPNLFTSVLVHKGRLWFTTAGSMTAWYLPIDSVGGEAKPFFLGSLFKRGGRLSTLERWSVDTGEGLDDRILFITTAGEIASYSGDDPSNAADWQLDSTYFVGAPLGPRATADYGGDVIMLTRRGLLPLSTLVQGSIDQVMYSNVLTRRISRTVNQLTRPTTQPYPVEVNFHPNLTAVIINIYDWINDRKIQLVMNALTGAWGKWDWPVRTIKSVDRTIYMGTDDGRVLLVAGTIDNVLRDGTGGDPIESYVFGAYSYLGDNTSNKHAKFMRPTFQTEVKPSFVMRALPDFRLDPFLQQPAPSLAKGNAKWDLSFWDQTNWAGLEQVYRPWVSANVLGYALAWQLRVSTSTLLAIASIQWVYEPGGLV